LEQNTISAVYANHDYEPYAVKRDKEIFEFLKEKRIEFRTFKDHVIFEKNNILKPDGTPYTVYTPYMKRWKEKLQKENESFKALENNTKNFAAHSYRFLTLDEIGFKESQIKVLPYNLSESLVDNYEDTRNFPHLNGTSLLSPHLRFGAVSIRQAVKKAAGSKNETFLNELIWREFFIQILWHF